jgi:hypothetical protein
VTDAFEMTSVVPTMLIVVCRISPFFAVRA